MRHLSCDVCVQCIYCHMYVVDVLHCNVTCWDVLGVAGTGVW